MKMQLLGLVIFAFIAFVGVNSWVNQRDQINRLSEQIEAIETIRKAENDHAQRELERQKRISEMERALDESNQQAYQDTSGSDCVFGPERMRRIQEIR